MLSSGDTICLTEPTWLPSVLSVDIEKRCQSWQPNPDRDDDERQGLHVGNEEDQRYIGKAERYRDDSYAALAGATFTGAVSGIAPTADAHFATKKYVADAIAALNDLSGVSF